MYKKYILVVFMLLIASLCCYVESFDIRTDNTIDSPTISGTQILNGTQMITGSPTISGILTVNTGINTTALTCASLNITSDRRIKKKIKYLESNDSLELLRKMKPAEYTFKNCLDSVYGFIAQDLLQSIPRTVTKHDKSIHNIYEVATCEGNVLTFPTFNTSDLSRDKTNLLYKIKTTHEDITVVDIIDEHSVRIDKELPKNVFVFGQDVSDFLTIDPNQLFTITTSALQELDRTLLQQKEDIRKLTNRLNRLEKNIDS